MELSKHKNHRNAKYLNWLRKRNCVVSAKPAECAHHIRLGTNGGTGLKPSDYFCIPLLNEYHVSGPSALHVIGEESFLSKFSLDPKALFISQLKAFLADAFEIYYMLEDRDQDETIAELIQLIEEKLPKLEKPSKAKKSKKKSHSSPDNEFYQKAKELKRERDKVLREKLKSEGEPAGRPSFKGNEVYERAKELKRQRDKELRRQMKAKSAKSPTSQSRLKFKENPFYEQAKEKRKAMERELRKKRKEKLKAEKKSPARRLKEALGKIE